MFNRLVYQSIWNMASHIIGHFVLSEPYEKLARSSDVVYFSMVAVWAKFQTLVIISKKEFLG